MWRFHQSQNLTIQKSCFTFFQRKPFKNEERCFLFHVKTFFRLLDISFNWDNLCKTKYSAQGPGFPTGVENIALDEGT